MNRRHCAITALFMIVGLSCAAARGAEPAAPVDPSIQPIVNIPAVEYTGPTESGIAPFVTQNVKCLMLDNEPEIRRKAREYLIAAAYPGNPQASPDFLKIYDKVLDAEFVKRLAPAAKPTLTQRLNIAVVVHRVASAPDPNGQAGVNAALQPTTLLLINDPAEPVVMWGLRGAAPQMRHSIQINTNLLKAIVPAAQKHPSGPIYEEAYKALNENNMLVVTELFKLWDDRLNSYKKGTSPADDPAVDHWPVYTMTTSDMWGLVILNNKNLQTKVMQYISDQLSLAAQWADKTGPGDTRDQLVQLVKLTAGGCVVVGNNQKFNALSTAAGPASTINATAFPPTQKLVPLVTPIITAIAAAFPNVQPPPVIAGGAAPAGGGAGNGGGQPVAQPIR